jgi:hypothetical protein
MIVDRVGVLSVGRTLGSVGLLFGIVPGWPLAAFAEGGTGLLMGPFLPFVSCVVGFVGGMLLAKFYNWTASFLGGIEIELSANPRKR